MTISMDAESRKNIEELERNSRFPTGVGRIERGECPAGALTPIGCTFCPYGHMLECHHPHTCEEAQCSHWEREMDGCLLEDDDPI